MAIRPKKKKLWQLIVITGKEVLHSNNDNGLHAQIARNAGRVVLDTDGLDEDGWTKEQNEAADACANLVTLFEASAPAEPDQLDLEALAADLEGKVTVL